MNLKNPKLSEKQEKALETIDTIIHELDKHSSIKESGMRRWFIQEELRGITLHTMKALVEKGYLETIDILGYPYYRMV